MSAFATKAFKLVTSTVLSPAFYKDLFLKAAKETHNNFRKNSMLPVAQAFAIIAVTGYTVEYVGVGSEHYNLNY